MTEKEWKSLRNGDVIQNCIRPSITWVILSRIPGGYAVAKSSDASYIDEATNRQCWTLIRRAKQPAKKRTVKDSLTVARQTEADNGWSKAQRIARGLVKQWRKDAAMYPLGLASPKYLTHCADALEREFLKEKK